MMDKGTVTGGKSNRPKKRFDRHRVDTIQAYSFLAPTFLIILVFFIAAIVFALYMSFNKVNMYNNQYTFRGLQNYLEIFKDNIALTALKNTSMFSLVVVPCQTVLALIIAYALSSKGIRFKKLFRLVYFLPTLTSSAALTLIFMFIFNVNGPVNGFLTGVGWLTKPINFLQDPQYALKVIMVMNIWSTVPNFMTVYLASLVDLPDSLYEAAEMDGANAWQKLMHITVPYLRPITTYVLLMGIISTFQMFDQAYIFSNGSGGPDNSTLTVALMVYQYAFGQMNTMGYACALALFLAVVIYVVARLAEKLNGGSGLANN